MLPLLATLLKNEEEQIFRLKDWKNGIIINRGNLGQGWIKPSDTDEGQIFTVVCACMCVHVYEKASRHAHMYCNVWEMVGYEIFQFAQDQVPDLSLSALVGKKQNNLPRKKKTPTGVLVVQSDNLSVSKVACGL